MRVTLTTWYGGHNPGDELEVDDAEGRVMINDGQAREVPPEPAAEGTEPSTSPAGAGGTIPTASPDAGKKPDPTL